MQRLYFLTPNVVSTVSIAHELNDMGIHRNAIHIVCKNERLLEGLDLNKASVRQTSDLMHAAKRGIIYGAAIGLIAGVIATMALPVETTFSVAITIAAVTAFGMLFGIWSSTLVGVSVQDVKVKKYQDDINKGHMLMLVDIPEAREVEVAAVIKQHHPEAQIERITVAEQQRHEGVGA